MALGADLNGDVLLGGAGLDDVAAGASDGGLLVILPSLRKTPYHMLS